MRKIFIICTIVSFVNSLFAALKVDTVFSSNMVLQQQYPIAFFGTADKGSVVKVEFNGKTVSAKTDNNGNWRAEFPAMTAGKTNYTVKISDGKSKIELKDILIGEVWFCSGQSNMGMRVGRKYQRGATAINCAQEVANSDYPEIRCAIQKRNPSPLTEASAQYASGGGWVKCSPNIVPNFSATAYFFGRELYKNLDIPIGLITSSWGGSAIQPWISIEGYKAANLRQEFKGMYEFYDGGIAGKKNYLTKECTRYREAMKKWQPLFEQAGEKAKQDARNWKNADFDDSSWEKAVQKMVPAKYIVRWYRTKFKVRNEMKGKTINFYMDKGGEKVDIWLNGKSIASWETYTTEDEKKVRLQITPDQLNQNGENVLAVRVVYLYGWVSGAMRDNVIFHSHFFLDKAKIIFSHKWKTKDEFVCTHKEMSGVRVPPFLRYASANVFPTNLYNGMVAPWTKLPVRGVIWYQGCSNSGLSYYPLLKSLIADWRAKWNKPDMPFLIVQLAGYDPLHAKTWKTSDPNTPHGNTLIRDIQQQMLNIPNVGLTCTIDIGEVDNIHPGNKQDVGKRLSLEAQRMVYGKNIVSRGPLFKSATPEKGAIRVYFENAGKGLKTSDGLAPGAFAVAGADKKFVWADAKIDGNTVVVSSPKIASPKYVRYAYAGYRGDCNLQNTEGLPAYPFRSDALDYSKVK